MTLTKTEEDYLKTLFYLIVESGQEKAGTNQLAEHLNVSPASVSSMLKKLKKKALVRQEKYGKLELTDKGKEAYFQKELYKTHTELCKTVGARFCIFVKICRI